MSKFWSTAVQRTEPYVPGEQLNEPDILKLNTNENPYPPSSKVLDAIREELGNHLNRYPSPTAEALKAEIAAYHGLDKEQVFLGNGSDEILAFSFMAFFEPGKTIRFPAVSYSFYPVYAKLFDIPYEEVELNEDFSISSADFFQSEGGVIFPNPNAPTSIYLGLDKVRAIAENNPDQVVIVDEAYVDFAENSAVSLIDDFDNLLIVQTMSKSRSLAGLRIGFAMGHPALIEGLTRIKDSFNSYTLDRLAIAGAIAAIRDRDYFAETVAKIIRTRESTSKALGDRGFHVLPSQANFLLVSHPEWTAESLYSSLKEAGVLVRYFAKPKISNHLRITIGSEEDMQLFVVKLDNILSQ
ncbi:histidinol-phosphate transaminase [Lentibacillus sediminis]|uniref:histidinol-phosphate transaminase n=1 Tax=Lentibacillus sediminis TaxID=1940529 RepID=UPI000C1C3EBA|nr:histidinol-phosphate transaminase [Lentibacillus sediminis]